MEKNKISYVKYPRSMPLFEVERITIEVVSAIACFILVRYMTKIYQLTRESRYLGLPLGFGFLGASYAFSAFSYSPFFDFTNQGWVQLIIRAFAFLFLAITYYFSKSDKKPKLIWNTTLTVLIVALTTLILFAIISPQVSRSEYVVYYIFVRIVSMICLGYIYINALKNQLEHSDVITLLAPVGYLLLATNQYSVLIWVIDRSYFALFGGLVFRLAGLAVFLAVAYKTFSRIDERGNI
jgi:fluoride ion exporter CrcB/FEX